MKKNEYIESLKEFIKKGTCAFTVVKEIENIFLENNFRKLEEIDNWQIKEGNYYIVRNDATIIGITIPKDYHSQFLICSTHCDTPSLLLKPEGENQKNNYLKYNVMPYGGLLNYGWLDRPLSIAGRIILEDNGEYQKEIIDLKEALAIIPSVAIHQNPDANSKLDLNMQKDLQPIFSIGNENYSLKKILEKKLKLKKKIKDFDLFLYNAENPLTIGVQNELLISPRIDNLTSVFGSLRGFLESHNKAINVFVSFNNEEIGSLTKEGAESSFLLDILKKLCASLKIDLTSSLANTFNISSDNTHAIHPNHDELMDDTGNLKINEGIAIIREVSSTTDSYFSTIFKSICDKGNIKYQNSTTKNDLSTGSTLSGLSLRHVSVKSIDIGIPMLAMHSSYECCGIDDIYYLYQAIKKYYQTDIIIDKEKTKLTFY